MVGDYSMNDWDFADVVFWLAVAFVLLLVGGIIAGYSENQKSDVPGFVVETDKMTGCQYLRPYGDDGPAMPRLDHNGKQVCVSVERAP